MVYEPSNRSTSTYWARIALLDAVRKVKPRALKDLCSLSLLLRVAKPTLERHYRLDPDLWVWCITESKRPNQDILPLRRAINAWARKYGLNFDWAIKHAIYSLIKWDDDMKSFRHGWFYAGLSPARFSENQTRFVFQLEEAWQPNNERQEEFTKRAKAAFANYLHTYVADIKALLIATNQVEARHKYKPLADGYDDFILLALKLVRKRSYQQIADTVANALQRSNSDPDADPDAEKIKRRVHRTAKLCGIELKTVEKEPRLKI